MFVEKKYYEETKNYEIDKSIIHKFIQKNIENLVRWKNYGPKNYQWRNIFELKNFMDQVKVYDIQKSTFIIMIIIDTTIIISIEKKA